MSILRSEVGGAARPHQTEGADNASQNQLGSIGVSIDIGEEKNGRHIRKKCHVLKVHEGGCAHGFLNVGDEIVAIDPAGGSNPVPIVFENVPGIQFDQKVEIDRIARLILGPPGTQVTLHIIRQPAGRSFAKKLMQFQLYRQILISSSPDIVDVPALADVSVPSPAETETLPSATTSTQPQQPSDSDVLKFSSISALDSKIYGVFHQLNFEAETIEKIESLLKVNPRAAMEAINETRLRLNIGSQSTPNVQQPPSASAQGGDSVAEEDDEEEDRVLSRIYSNKQSGISAIGSFLKEDSYGGHFQLTIYGQNFNNKPEHRKDMWVRLLTYDRGNPRICHEWITGKKRYLRKEHARKDDKFSFNKPGSGTTPEPEPFVFDLAAMLQGQRSKYNSTMVRIVVMKQQKQSQTSNFCDIREENELGCYECKLDDLIQNTNPAKWFPLERSSLAERVLHGSPGDISFKQVHWATSKDAQPRADGVSQADEPPMNPDKCFKLLEKLFAARQLLQDRSPKFSELYLRETVETLEEILKPQFFNYYVSPQNTDTTQSVIDNLASKMKIFEGTFNSEGWYQHENYRAVGQNIQPMLARLTDKSMLRNPAAMIQSELDEILQELKIIEAAMFPMNLSKLVDLMHKVSTASQDMRGRKVSLMIGSSQAGKSTILNFLAGANLKKVSFDGVESIRLKNIPENLPLETKEALQHITIGSGYRSETIHVRLLPVKHNNVFHYLCDAPGFGDDRGPEIDISNGVGVISALRKCLKVKIILVFSGDERGNINQGLEGVFANVSDLISINPNECRHKLIYLLNKAENIRNFHEYIHGVYKQRPPPDNAIKRIFEDAMCKTCCEECAILKAALSDPYQGPVAKYDSVHVSLARHLASRSAAVSGSADESDFGQIFAKQKQTKLTLEDLTTKASSSAFRRQFLDYVGRDDMEIDPNLLRFVCSEKSISKLHATLDHIFLQLKHFCSKKHFRPDIIEVKIRQLVLLEESGLFRECPSGSRNVNIFQDYQNIRSFILKTIEALTEEVLGFFRQPLSIAFNLEPFFTFWRLVQLLNTHNMIAKADEFDAGSSEPKRAPLSEFFNRWALYQDSLAQQCLDALKNAMEGKFQSARPSENLKVLVQTMCAVTDLCTYGQDFPYLSPDLLKLGESTSCILKEKYKQTLVELIKRYEELCAKTSSSFKSQCQADIHFFIQDNLDVCIAYFQNLKSIRNVADVLLTICPHQTEQDDGYLGIDELCPTFTKESIESKKGCAHRALFDVLSSIPVFSLMNSAVEQLDQQCQLDEILKCLQNSVLTPLSIFHSILNHETASSWDFYHQATALRCQFVQFLQDYFCKMPERCRRISLEASMSAASISDIKAHIFQSVGIPVVHQRLLHKNTELSDSDKVPVSGNLHLTLFHSSHADIPETGAGHSSAADAGSADVQHVFLPDLLFPIFERSKRNGSSQTSRGLVHLFNHWFIVLKMTEKCLECLEDASFSTFVSEFQQNIIAKCHNFLKILRKNANDFIDNIDSPHDNACEDSDWDCFCQYMIHLSNFADRFGDTLLSGKKLFPKECQYFSDIFKNSKNRSYFLSHNLAENSEQLSLMNFKLESLNTTMNHKCNSMFVAGDELLRLLQAFEKIQAGCVDEFWTQCIDNCQGFVKSMSQLIESLPFLHQDSAAIALNKLNSLLCLQTECLENSREGTLLCLETGCLDSAHAQSSLATEVRLAIQTSVGNWNEFLKKCSSSLEEISQSIGILIRFFQEHQKSDEEFSAKWTDSLAHVKRGVKILFGHDSEIRHTIPSPIYKNLKNFMELQSHPLFTSRFIQSSDLVLSKVLNAATGLIRQIDTLFLKLRSFCSEVESGVEGQGRYQRLLDLLSFCQDCFEVDSVWAKPPSVEPLESEKMTNAPGEVKLEREQSQSFADHYMWVQGELATQRVSMDMQHSHFIETLDVDGLLKVWPDISKDAQRQMLQTISQKLKISLANLKSKWSESLQVSMQESQDIQAAQLNVSRLSQDADSKTIIFAVASWVPAFFKEDVETQKSLFKALDDVYVSMLTNKRPEEEARAAPGPVELSVKSCVGALEKCEFQKAEKIFRALHDFHVEVDQNLKAVLSVTNAAAEVKAAAEAKAVAGAIAHGIALRESTAKQIEEVMKQTSDHIAKLREMFVLATQKVLKMFDCKSAMIKSPSNIAEHKDNFDNLFIQLPVAVGIGIEIIQSQSKILGISVEVAHVFYGSPSWLAGIRKHDVLLHVDTLPCSQHSKTSIDAIKQRIMGPIGTVVDIQIIRNNHHTMSFSVKRAIFDSSSSSAGHSIATALQFHKFSSLQSLDFVFLLEDLKFEKMQTVPSQDNVPAEIQADQFCSLNFTKLRHKSYGFLHVLRKLDVSPEYRKTGTAYDDIQKLLKSKVDKQLSFFVDLLSSKCLTPIETRKWQELNSDILSEEFLQHLPENITRGKLQKLHVESSGEKQLKNSSVKPSSSISSDIDTLQNYHPLGTPSIKHLLNDIEERICSHCDEISRRDDFLESFFDPHFREDFARWNIFWHFLHCVYPSQSISEHKSWQAWDSLKNLFKKSSFEQIPCNKTRSSTDEVISDNFEPRLCFSFSEAAFTQLDFSKSQEVVSAVKASFCFLQQKPFWNHALLTDFFNDFEFHKVLHRVCATLVIFFKDQKLHFDDWLSALSRKEEHWRNVKVDHAWMTAYYKIYMGYSSISDFLKKVSGDESITWIGDSNGTLLPDFGPLIVSLNPSASSNTNKFPFSVETYEELDQRIRVIFQHSMESVKSQFWLSDDSRSPSTLNNDRLYKKLNDNHQICRVFSIVFAETKWITKLSDNVYDDAFAYFDRERVQLFSNPDGILYEVDIGAQFARQIECYGRLMILHNNLTSWKKHFEDTFVKTQIDTKISRLNADMKLLKDKVRDEIHKQAISSAFPQDFEQNLLSLCGRFRFLRCMASNLPLEIDGTSVAFTIDCLFKDILASSNGSARMKKISSSLISEKEKSDDTLVVRFSSELLEKHKAFENVQIFDYNISTRGFTIDTILELLLTNQKSHLDASSIENIKQHYAYYNDLCNQRIKMAYSSIKRGPRDSWKLLLKSALRERCEMINLSPNHKVLEVLAASSVYWTMDIYASGAVDDTYEPPWEQLKTPHAAQIVAILRLLGLDKMPLPEFKDDGVGTKVFVFLVGKDDPLRAVHEFLLQNMDPHMVEVLTGQGKSVVLALTSIVLAFFNFRVDCACYSEYLSARDRIEFKNVFEFFDVAEFIAYSTFNTLCERTINELGEVRGAVLQLVSPGQVVSTSQSTAKLSADVDTLRKKIALIDEVDVFFSKSFYGQEYIPVARVRHACISALIQQVYELSTKKLQLNEFTTQDIEEHLGSLYKQCKDAFKGWEFLIEHAVVCMLCDVMQYEDTSKNPYQKVEKGSCWRLGYKEGDQISFIQTRRYMTVFSWLKEHSLDPKSVDKDCMEQQFCLLVDCGHFGYEKLVRIGDEQHDYACILGVTGTLKAIMDDPDGGETEQRKILDKFCRREAIREANRSRELKTLQCTYVPTVYAQAKGTLIFTEKSSKGAIWFVKHYEEFYLTILAEIQSCTKDSNSELKVSRAVLVVFETSQELHQCADNRALEPFKGVIQKLTPEISDEMVKKNIIEQASFPGKVTFMTREFGRGTDFKGTNKEMNECGGVHVIQTFLSEDFTEETQIKGRTARQGQNGSYCLVLLCKSLEKYLTSFKYDASHPPESCKDEYRYFVGSDDGSIKGYLQELPAADAYKILHAARKIFFTKDFQNSIHSKGSGDHYHQAAMNFRVALNDAVRGPVPARAPNIAKVKEFLKSMNGSILPEPIKRPIRRTMVLLDATGSMGRSIEGCKKTISDVCSRAYDTLKAAKVDAAFELQFTTFRNYDCEPAQLLCCSQWAKSPDELRLFLQNVRACGGTHWEEAVEVALQYANSENSRNPISQAILIGDAAPNTQAQVTAGRAGTSRGGKLPSNYWQKTPMAEPTFWEIECEKLRKSAIPVHAFYVDPSAQASFANISQKAGEGGVCRDLDMKNPQAATILCNLLTNRILESLGQTEEEKKLFKDLYLKIYADDARIMH